ncbi:MAG: O-antigen ligase family protein [Betaproteobacteria bacterium]|nr:O-antigen ligase family protein [Betaproteobacteria bacterium]
MSALWGGGGFSQASKYSLYILCLMLSVQIVSQKISENFVMKFIIFIGLIASIVYIVGILLSDNDLTTFMNGRFSFHDIVGWGRDNPIHSGMVIGVSFIAAWYLFPEKKLPVQLILLVTIMLGALLLLVTKSRGPMLSAAIILLCLALYRRKKSDLIFLFMLAIFAGLLFLFSNNFNQSVAERFNEDSYRLSIWREVLNIFMNHWLFGQGVGASVIIADELSFRHSHNIFFDILRVGGIVGGLLFVYMFVSMVRLSYIRPANMFYLLWLVFGLLSLFTNGKLPLCNPGGMEIFAFWIPLFLFYYMRKCPDSPTTNINKEIER